MERILKIKIFAEEKFCGACENKSDDGWCVLFGNKLFSELKSPNDWERLDKCVEAENNEI